MFQSDTHWASSLYQLLAVFCTFHSLSSFSVTLCTQVEEYLAQDLTQTNRMMAESLLKNEGFPVHMVTTSCPHYVKGRQDMLCYSLEEKKVTSKV